MPLTVRGRKSGQPRSAGVGSPRADGAERRVYTPVESREEAREDSPMEQPAGPAWAKRFFAVTPIVDDLAVARQWYVDVFGMPIVDESEGSCTFRFPGDVFINLNVREGVAELIDPAPAGPPGTPARMMLTLTVTDVDAVLARLRGLGIEPLNGPTDRPWGSRTATIADPSGNVWELSS